MVKKDAITSISQIERNIFVRWDLVSGIFAFKGRLMHLLYGVHVPASSFHNSMLCPFFTNGPNRSPSP